MAYSRLSSVLAERHMTVPELHRKLGDEGVRVNLKTLYQLAQASRLIGRLDLRVVEAICHTLDVPLTQVIDIRPVPLERFPAPKQQRMDELLDLNNQGRLSPEQRTELEALVFEAQALTLSNAKALGQAHRPVRRQ